MEEEAPRPGTLIVIVLTLLALVAAGAVLWQYRTDDTPKQSGGVQLSASEDQSAGVADPTTDPTAGPTGPTGPTTDEATDGATDLADDACGAAVPKPGGGTWTCTFADDFEGGGLDPEQWAAQDAMSSGSGRARACTVDSPGTVAVAGGTLRLTVRPGRKPVRCQQRWASYLAGSVSTSGLFSQRYGRFEARIKAPATLRRGTPGLHEAFWLWPAAPGAGDAWPASGEIDVAETYSDQPGLAVPYVHYGARDNGGPVVGTNTADDCRAARGRWHDYVLVWTPTELRISVDGRPCLVNDADDDAFDQAFQLNLTAQLGSDANAYRGGRPMPATTQVDYVRVWQ